MQGLSPVGFRDSAPRSRLMNWEKTSLDADVLDKVRQRVDKPREGIHLSDLLLCLRKTYYRRQGLLSPTDKECLLYVTGLSIHEFLAPESEFSLVVDGITCSPDAYGWEIKSGRMSSKNFYPSSHPHWEQQILGYCKALGITEYYLTVFFLVGDYSPPFPQIQVWKVVATQEEIDRNWSEMLRRRDVLVEALETGIPPPTDTTLSWECQYCSPELCPDFYGARAILLKRRLQE